MIRHSPLLPGATRRLGRWALLVCLLVLGTAVGGCNPTARPTPTIGSTYGPALPSSTTAQALATAPQPTATIAQPTATVAQPTASPKIAATSSDTEREAVALTILHTNDVEGEVDPCG